MNKALNKYVNEIISIAGENGVDWSNGPRMFLANVKNFGNPDAPHYAGAGNLDWATVGADLTPFTDVDEADMINTYCACYREHMSGVIAARSAGDHDKAVEIMTNA